MDYRLRVALDQNIIRFSSLVWSENLKTKTGSVTLNFLKKTEPDHLDRRPDQILKFRFGLRFRPNFVQPQLRRPS